VTGADALEKTWNSPVNPTKMNKVITFMFGETFRAEERKKISTECPVNFQQQEEPSSLLPPCLSLLGINLALINKASGSET